MMPVAADISALHCCSRSAAREVIPSFFDASALGAAREGGRRPRWGCGAEGTATGMHTFNLGSVLTDAILTDGRFLDVYVYARPIRVCFPSGLKGRSRVLV